MLSIEAFSLGNELVHVQAVPGSSIDSPVVIPRHDNVKVRKTSRIFSGEIPLPQRLLEIPEGWDWSITYFSKG